MKKSVAIFGIIIIFALLYFFVVYGVNKSQKTTVKLVKTNEFSKLVDSEIFTLQVHTPYYGEINGTDLVIEDWRNIEKYLDKLPPKNEPIAIYCRSGKMSGEVSKKLSDLGYQIIYDLDGGMNSWQKDGKDLIINDKT